MLAGSAMFGPYEPPASLCSASPFCSAKRGGFAAAAPGIPRSMALLAPSRAPVVGLLGLVKGAGDGKGRLYGVVK